VSSIAATTPIATSDVRAHRDVEPRRTPVSTADLRSAIGRAYRRLAGGPPSSAMLDTLTAQASLETGGGAQMYNYNFGGIKAGSHAGDRANYLTHEVVAGKDLTVRQAFRAYTSLDEGAEDYVRVLSHNFGTALSSAQVGDVRGFAHALKQAGYYTASEDQYASALQSLGGPHAGVDALQSVPSMQTLVAGGAPRSAEDLTRVLDALANSALRIGAPESDDA
jgi:flagellar protein FlgJ